MFHVMMKSLVTVMIEASLSFTPVLKRVEMKERAALVSY